VVNGAPEIKIKIYSKSKSKSKSGSLRIVVTVVDTYAPTAVFQSAGL